MANSGDEGKDDSKSSEQVGHSSEGHHHEREFLCGWGAAFINICVTFPINKVMFRQMHHGVAVDDAIAQLRTEGMRNLYRGLLPPLLAKTASVSLMFGSFSTYRDFLADNCEWLTPTPFSKTAVASILAGSTEAVLLAPFERIQMLLQAREFQKRFKNTQHAFMDLRKYGIKEYYRGLTPILLRNGPSNLVFFSLRDEVKHVFPRSDVWWINLVENFVTGALLGAFISTLFYPINVIRTKIQTVPLGNEYLTMKQAAKMVYEERNKKLSKIFYGVHINYTRALISWGIINASYEVLKSLLVTDSEKVRGLEHPTHSLFHNKSGISLKQEK
ncbi:Mitochondrial nicotinamide adenine dinucleotide transporter SLC25A51 [Halotydeus destructor]|nr:Mitochondrial nicotinamide adenine dinucleotide transporter SLC25A51 [Halotydeus destructor]